MGVLGNLPQRLADSRHAGTLILHSLGGKSSRVATDRRPLAVCRVEPNASGMCHRRALRFHSTTACAGSASRHLPGATTLAGK